MRPWRSLPARAAHPDDPLLAFPSSWTTSDGLRLERAIFPSWMAGHLLSQPRCGRLDIPWRASRMLVTEAGTRSQTWGPPIRDAEVRPALRRYLRRDKSAYADTLLIEELGLCQGQARIDLLTVSGLLHGYEIKSNRDRLTRLASQAATYSRVLDRVTLVVCPRHIRAALQLVPKWWGVLLVRGSAEAVSLDPFRPAGENPDQDPRALVELLWRDEALELLAHHNAQAGVRSKRRPVVWDRVCEVLDVTEIRSAVRYRLRTRAATSTPA